MTRVGIVCGYGTDAARLTSYTRGVIGASTELDLLVTSGRGSPLTEADVLADLLRPAGLPILREPHARTTAENLFFSRELLTRERVEIGQLTIFCDGIRRWKVEILSRFVFGRRARVVAIGRQGARWLFLAQPLSLLWQLLGLTVRNRTLPFDDEQ